jgi:hypothetical protein
MVKLLIISIIETLGVENIWDNVLGKKVSQTFGQECASAAIWMFFILMLRSALLLLGLTPYVPNGIIFSFPYLIQVNNRTTRIYLYQTRPIEHTSHNTVSHYTLSLPINQSFPLLSCSPVAFLLCEIARPSSLCEWWSACWVESPPATFWWSSRRTSWAALWALCSFSASVPHPCKR